MTGRSRLAAMIFSSPPPQFGYRSVIAAAHLQQRCVLQLLRYLAQVLLHTRCRAASATVVSR
jgi:hypothetical protein